MLLVQDLYSHFSAKECIEQQQEDQLERRQSADEANDKKIFLDKYFSPFSSHPLIPPSF